LQAGFLKKARGAQADDAASDDGAILNPGFESFVNGEPRGAPG
jgi:hypothetical protein